MRGSIKNFTFAGKFQHQQLRRLNLHEYQGAELMAKYGINVPKGVAITSLDEVQKAIKETFPGQDEVVVKSQVLAGGRGLGSAVQSTVRGGRSADLMKRSFSSSAHHDTAYEAKESDKRENSQDRLCIAQIRNVKRNQVRRHIHLPSKPQASIRPFTTASSSSSSSSSSGGITMKGVTIPGRPLYLDMQATTPVDPRVMDAMLPYYISQYGNPHSRTHLYGWESESAVESARSQVSSLIRSSPKEIIFTSGATESNNISIKGLMRFNSSTKRHLITTQTEHKCVLDSCRHLHQQGFHITYLPVRKDGLIDLDQLRAAIRPDTGLVSVMMVNNEIGVIQPMEEIGHICKEFNIPFHTDAAQALGKVEIDVEKMNISLMSLSGHKIYGPKGVGALYIRRRPRVRVEPQMNGGGQERGIRSGTVPTPLVVGFGAACEVAQREMAYDEARIKGLQERLLKGIRDRIDAVEVNGSEERRYAGNLNLSFRFVEGESMLMGLKEVAVSSGSACTSASLEPSYVLRALGVDEEMAHTSIRFGIGRFTTEEEIDRAVELTVKQVKKLRDMSPLYEMYQQGIDIKSIEWSQH